MAIRNELVEELLAGHDPSEVFAQDGLLDELKKALAERILNAELDQHLAAERSGAAGEGPGNHRNGTSRKTVLTGTGKLDLQIPRDRQASFEPQLIAKYRRRFPDFDDKVVSLYARGLTVREIQGHLRELYGIDVSPDLVSAVTDAVLEQVAEWQNRPLDAVYALVFFDALRVKIRDEGTVRNKAVYIALGVRRQWEQVIPFYAYPLEVRRMIYTTNAIESLNSCLRKAVRLRGHFPTDEAATKLLFLVLREVSRDWKMPPREWNAAKTQFAVLFGDRFVVG